MFVKHDPKRHQEVERLRGYQERCTRSWRHLRALRIEALNRWEQRLLDDRRTELAGRMKAVAAELQALGAF